MNCSFHDLLHNKTIPELNKFLTPNLELSFLDLGCGFPHLIFCLLHDTYFNHIVGVDCASPELLCQKQTSIGITDPISHKSEDLIFRLYQKSMQFDGREVPGRETFFSSDEFNKSVQIYHSTELESYLVSFNESFDVIHLQNVLHIKPNNYTTIMNLCMDRLKPKGMVYVKVHHESHDVDDNLKYRFTDEMFLKLFEGFKLLYLKQNIACKDYQIETPARYKIGLGIK